MLSKGENKEPTFHTKQNRGNRMNSCSKDSWSKELCMGDAKYAPILVHYLQ
jgi:hypothetical protein